MKTKNRDVIIVSRDADYGLTHDDKGYANNWLAEEIKERTNKLRKLILVDRLSAALKKLSIPVTREEITSERAIMHATSGGHEEEIEHLVIEASHELIDDEQINSLMAGTNAVGWGCDTFDLSNIRYVNGQWTADMEFTLSGDQEDDKSWCGTRINGNCRVAIDKDKKVTFYIIEAEIDRGDEDMEEPDEMDNPEPPDYPEPPDDPEPPDEPGEPCRAEESVNTLPPTEEPNDSQPDAITPPKQGTAASFEPPRREGFFAGGCEPASAGKDPRPPLAPPAVSSGQPHLASPAQNGCRACGAQVVPGEDYCFSCLGD